MEEGVRVVVRCGERARADPSLEPKLRASAVLFSLSSLLTCCYETGIIAYLQHQSP